MIHAKDAIASKLESKRLARVMGRPTRKAVNKTRGAIAAAYAEAKTSHPSFPLGSKFGFAAAVMLPDKYRARHNTIAAAAGSDALPDDWEFVHPIRPSTYDAGILATHNDNTRRRKESIHTDLINQYEAFTLYEDLYKYKLEEAFDEAYFSTLKDELFGFAGQTVAAMLHHLDKQCLALTGREKKEKMDSINLEWNQDDDIETYFVKADKLEEELLLDYGITWPTSMKITQVIDQMYASNVFSEDDMMDWEDKDDDEKTWIHLQSYFKRKWTKKRRYRGDTPKDHGFAANVEERETDAMDRLGTNLREVATAATADKEHIQQMSTQNDDLLNIVKKQQLQIDKLINQVTELTSQNTKLIQILGTAPPNTNNNNNANNNINNNPPNYNRNNNNNNNNRNYRRSRTYRGGQSNQTNTNQNDSNTNVHPKCAVCGRRSHLVENCWELAANKDKRPDTWVSIL